MEEAIIIDIPFHNMEEFTSYLYGLGQFRMELDLGRIEHCLSRLGRGTPPYRMARVVGTNGKGSTSYMLSRLAAAHGLRVGLFTSPHFLDVRERLLVMEGGTVSMPEDKAWLDLARTIFGAGPAGLPGSNQGLTYFEFLLAMAVEHFARERVDFAVFEAGLGARYDAVTALSCELLLLTNIGHDHEKQLGPDIASVAEEKSWSLRQGARLALSAPQVPEAWSHLERASREAGTPLNIVDDIPALPVSLDSLAMPGGHQRTNARLSLAGLRAVLSWFGVEPDIRACQEVLEKAVLPGRMQIAAAAPGRHPHLVLDGAHNPDGLRALSLALEKCGLRPRACISAMMRDKPLDKMARLMPGLVSGPLFLPRLSGMERAAPPEVLADLFMRNGMEARRITVCADLTEALGLALEAGCTAGEPALLCGSLFLLAEFFKLRPELVRFG